MRKIIFYVVLTPCVFIRIYFNYRKTNYVYIRDSFVNSKNDGVLVRIRFVNYKKYYVWMRIIFYLCDINYVFIHISFLNSKNIVVYLHKPLVLHEWWFCENRLPIDTLFECFWEIEMLFRRGGWSNLSITRVAGRPLGTNSWYTKHVTRSMRLDL